MQGMALAPCRVDEGESPIAAGMDFLDAVDVPAPDGATLHFQG